MDHSAKNGRTRWLPSNLRENSLCAFQELFAFVRCNVAFFDQALDILDEIEQMGSNRREIALTVAQTDEAARCLEQGYQRLGPLGANGSWISQQEKQLIDGAI